MAVDHDLATAPVHLSLLPRTSATGEDGHLLVGGVDVLDLAAEFGTPLFVYDEAHLRLACRDAVAAWGEGVAYATKAFLCRAMAALADEEGMHLDVASGALWSTPSTRSPASGACSSPGRLGPSDRRC